MKTLKAMNAALDLSIADRVRGRRKALGLTQKALSQLMDVPFQNIHKYEAGLISLKGSDLYRLSQALRVPITFFFGASLANEAPVYGTDADLMAAWSPEMQALAEAYSRIPLASRRHQLLELAQSLADAPGSLPWPDGYELH